MGIELSTRPQAPPGVRQGVSPYGKWHPESVSIATRRGTRVRVQRRDRFNSGTRERGSDSDRRRRAPFPSAPGEELLKSLREGAKPDGRDAKRLGSREPGAAPAARAQAEEIRQGLKRRT